MTRSLIAGALAALALSALACVNTAPAGAPTSEEVLPAKTRGEMLRVTTVEPLRCPASRDGWEICVWQLGDRNAAWYALAQTLSTRYRVNVICEFPNGGGARERDCLALPAASPPTQGRMGHADQHGCGRESAGGRAIRPARALA